MDTNILAIAIATVSSFVFILAILLLLLYQRDPQCCQFLCSCRFFQDPSQCDCPPPYFSNNQDLVGPARSQPSERMRTRVQGHFQGDEVFCVGLPSNYQLPPWRPPRLPSYESVRKKDRQQQIHQLIAHRFGLWACRELPPTYEESLGPLPNMPPALALPTHSREQLPSLLRGILQCRSMQAVSSWPPPYPRPTQAAEMVPSCHQKEASAKLQLC